eukprot:SAG22_NODE_213_length_15041_cov_3.683732_6_plen_291_part_00
MFYTLVRASTSGAVSAVAWHSPHRKADENHEARPVVKMQARCPSPHPDAVDDVHRGRPRDGHELLGHRQLHRARGREAEVVQLDIELPRDHVGELVARPGLKDGQTDIQTARKGTVLGADNWSGSTRNTGASLLTAIAPCRMLVPYQTTALSVAGRISLAGSRSTVAVPSGLQAPICPLTIPEGPGYFLVSSVPSIKTESSTALAVVQRQVQHVVRFLGGWQPVGDNMRDPRRREVGHGAAQLPTTRRLLADPRACAREPPLVRPHVQRVQVDAGQALMRADRRQGKTLS